MQYINDRLTDIYDRKMSPAGLYVYAGIPALVKSQRSVCILSYTYRAEP